MTDRGRRPAGRGGGDARRRDRARHPEGEGGPGADQRHRRDPRHARARARRPRALLRVADITAAMSVEALLGTDRAFAEDLIALRPQPGQAASAANLRALLAGSRDRRQPPRGRPPGPGRLLAALRAPGGRRRPRRARLRRGRRRRRAGRRDRQPDDPSRRPGRVVRQLPRRPARPGLRLPGDRRRRGRPRSPSAAPTGSSTPSRSHGLPPFLAEDAGVNSGMMIAQYTQAAMVAENRRLAAPASVDSLPTSAMQEDHVSMGWGAARKLRAAARQPCPDRRGGAACAARGLDLRAPLSPAAGTAAALGAVRAAVPGPGPDRWLAPGARRGRGAGRRRRPARRGRGRDRRASMRSGRAR